jgi:hypothetical protein
MAMAAVAGYGGGGHWHGGHGRHGGWHGYRGWGYRRYGWGGWVVAWRQYLCRARLLRPPLLVAGLWLLPLPLSLGY